MKDFDFLAYISEETESGFKRSIKKKNTKDLPQNELLIKVHYSSLNYKDGLSARGHKGISRYYPHTPGVDASGVVVWDKSGKFKSDDEVVVVGYDLGMNTAGGFEEYICVPSGWANPIPKGMDLKSVMEYGTAGMTVAICISEMEKFDIFPDQRNILVTGSTGAVGSLAVGMLSKAGYNVTASTGKPEKAEMLKQLGAKEVISRSEVYDTSAKPLLERKYASVIDTVGGITLSTCIRSCDYHGIVCTLGLVESDKLDISVYPFILRGISLVGIDSAEKKIEYKKVLWDRIANEWRVDNYSNFVKEVSLLDIDNEIELILQGKQAGKILINCKVSKDWNY